MIQSRTFDNFLYRLLQIDRLINQENLFSRSIAIYQFKDTLTLLIKDNANHYLSQL